MLREFFFGEDNIIVNHKLTSCWIPLVHAGSWSPKLCRVCVKGYIAISEYLKKAVVLVS